VNKKNQKKLFESGPGAWKHRGSGGMAVDEASQILVQIFVDPKV
jgi:hypothetical protein